MISRRKAWKIQEDRTMIKLIVGTKGSGKTKAMIDQINDAVKTSKGNVVVVEKRHEADLRHRPRCTSDRSG